MDLSVNSEGGRSESVRVEVSYLPGYYEGPQAGRSDLKARRKVGSVNDTQDLETAVRMFARAPGAYYAAAYVGREMTKGDVFHVEQKGQTLVIGGEEAAAQQAAPAAPPAAVVAQQAAPVDPNVHAMNTTLATMRVAKEIVRETMPTQPAVQPVTRDDVRAMIREMAAEIAEQLKIAQPTQPAPPAKSLTEQAREIKEAAEVLGITGGQQQPAQQPGGEIESVLGWMERIDNFRDRMRPSGYDGEDAGTLDKVLRFADRHADKLAALPGLLAMIRPGRVQEMAAAAGVTDVTAQQTGAQQQQQQQSAPAQQPQGPQNAAEAFALIGTVASAELIKNRRTGRTADLIEEMARTFPEIGEQVGALVEMPPGEVLGLFQTVTGRNDLAGYGHALDWIEDLQRELRGDGEVIEEDEDAPAAPLTSNNGTGATAAKG
jgi:hypothetical protein